MNITNQGIDNVFNTLDSAGYSYRWQSMVLPDWVTPEVLADEATSSEIAAILAKRFGLRVSSLLSVPPRVEALRRHDIKYKRSTLNKHKDLKAAYSIATSVAEAVSAACEIPFTPFETDANAFRTAVLASGGYWVGFCNILMHCWSHGVPVVYLREVGKDQCKMDGMVIHTGERPVIILSKASPLWAWQLFILAHEVSHILLGHIDPGEILIDEDIGEDSYALQDNDLEERAADAKALEILNGPSKVKYRFSEGRFNHIELADGAYLHGKANQIDPGHIVLNVAHRSGQWDLGMAAAKILQGANPPAPAVIKEAMWGGIMAGRLPNDTINFLDKVTGSYDRFPV